MHQHYRMPITITGHSHTGADGWAVIEPHTDEDGYGDVVPEYTDAHTHGLAYAAPALCEALEALLKTSARPTRMHNETAAEYEAANRAYEDAVTASLAALALTGREEKEAQ